MSAMQKGILHISWESEHPFVYDSWRDTLRDRDDPTSFEPKASRSCEPSSCRGLELNPVEALNQYHLDANQLHHTAGACDVMHEHMSEQHHIVCITVQIDGTLKWQGDLLIVPLQGIYSAIKL